MKHFENILAARAAPVLLRIIGFNRNSPNLFKNFQIKVIDDNLRNAVYVFVRLRV